MHTRFLRWEHQTLAVASKSEGRKGGAFAVDFHDDAFMPWLRRITEMIHRRSGNLDRIAGAGLGGDIDDRRHGRAGRNGPARIRKQLQRFFFLPGSFEQKIDSQVAHGTKGEAIGMNRDGYLLRRIKAMVQEERE